MAVLTWLGHAGFLIECQGRKLAIDAWMDGPTFPGTRLDDVGLVLVSHGHHDHCSSAPEICQASGATLLCIHEITFWAKQQGLADAQIVGMNKGGSFEWEGWRFTMVDAAHSSGCPGDDGGIVYGGAAAGWVIRCPDGDVIYHAGDTAVFGDMALIARMHAPHVALLPIGGHYTMDPDGAAVAAGLLGVAHVVPMHYGTSPLLAGTPARLRERLPVGVAMYELVPGQRLDLRPLVGRGRSGGSPPAAPGHPTGAPPGAASGASPRPGAPGGPSSHPSSGIPPARPASAASPGSSPPPVPAPGQQTSPSAPVSQPGTSSAAPPARRSPSGPGPDSPEV